MTPAIKRLTLEQQSGFYRSTLHLVNMLYSQPMTKPAFVTQACKFLMLPLTARPDLKINHGVMNLAFSKQALPRSEIYDVMQRNGLLVPKIKLTEPSRKDLVSLNAAQEMGMMSKYIEQNQTLSNIHIMPADTTKLLNSPGFAYLYPGLRRMTGQKNFEGVYQLEETPALKCFYAFDVKSGNMDLSITKMHLYHLFLHQGKEQVPPLLSSSFDYQIYRGNVLQHLSGVRSTLTARGASEMDIITFDKRVVDLIHLFPTLKPQDLSNLNQIEHILWNIQPLIRQYDLHFRVPQIVTTPYENSIELPYPNLNVLNYPDISDSHNLTSAQRRGILIQICADVDPAIRQRLTLTRELNSFEFPTFLPESSAELVPFSI